MRITKTFTALHIERFSFGIQPFGNTFIQTIGSWYSDILMPARFFRIPVFQHQIACITVLQYAWLVT
jgi:hypothetical protein